MKHAVLRSVAHNIADSLASGVGLLIGVYELDVFGEALKTQDGCLTVDFLAGTALDATPTPQLTQALRMYRAALPAFCAKHGVAFADFRALSARYDASSRGCRYVVTVEDRNGRCSSAEYEGIPGRRTEVLDAQGRRRAKPVRRGKAPA